MIRDKTRRRLESCTQARVLPIGNQSIFFVHESTRFLPAAVSMSRTFDELKRSDRQSGFDKKANHPVCIHDCCFDQKHDLSPKPLYAMFFTLGKLDHMV